MFYSLIKYILRIYLPLFFKKIHIEGFANVPKDQPILFAVNHQNTILDAVLTGISLKKNTSFLVRADFFKNSLFNWFFDKLQLIPISRGQDKRGNLITFNQQTFSKCVTCLAQKKPILIFPEGTSSATHKLSKFKKGVARLAFQAESAHDFKLDLQVIPVTINYENHFKGQTEVWIKYGKPIIPSQKKESYKKNQVVAVNSLVQEIECHIQKDLLTFSNEVCPEDFFSLAKSKSISTTTELIALHQSYSGKKNHWEKKENKAQKKRKHIALFLLGLITKVIFFPAFVITITLNKIVDDKDFKLSIISFSLLVFSLAQTLLTIALITWKFNFISAIYVAFLFFYAFPLLLKTYFK